MFPKCVYYNVMLYQPHVHASRGPKYNLQRNINVFYCRRTFKLQLSGTFMAATLWTEVQRFIFLVCVYVCVCVCIYIYIYIYMACKSSFRQNYRTTFLAHSSIFRCWDLSRRCGRGGTWRRKWERLKGRGK